MSRNLNGVSSAEFAVSRLNVAMKIMGSLEETSVSSDIAVRVVAAQAELAKAAALLDLAAAIRETKPEGRGPSE